MAAALDAERPVRWGIQGAGGIARAMGAAIAASPDSVVQAVAARDGDRARDLADRLGADTAHGDYAALADDPDVDVVYVATTHGQHYPQVRRLLEAGKPVLVEKSFTVNADQAAVLAELARERRLFCMEALWSRCLPSVRAAVDAAATRIGRVVGLRCDLSRRFDFDPTHRLWDPATGGGVGLDMGVYVAHLAWAFLGAPEQVTATGRRAPNGVDASVAMQWAYADGSFAHLAATFAGTSADPHTVVTGEHGWVALHGRTHEPSRTVVHVDGAADEVTEHGHVGFGPQVAEVERALREGDLVSPLVPMADTVGVLRTLDTARRTLGVHYGELEEV